MAHDAQLVVGRRLSVYHPTWDTRRPIFRPNAVLQRRRIVFRVIPSLGTLVRSSPESLGPKVKNLLTKVWNNQNLCAARVIGTDWLHQHLPHKFSTGQLAVLSFPRRYNDVASVFRRVCHPDRPRHCTGSRVNPGLWR